MMSINAVKGVEIGDGFAAADIPGHEAADEMRIDGGRPGFLSNHAGGVLGGLSPGQDLVERVAVKPARSIPLGRKRVDQRQWVSVRVTRGGRRTPKKKNNT